MRFFQNTAKNFVNKSLIVNTVVDFDSVMIHLSAAIWACHFVRHRLAPTWKNPTAQVAAESIASSFQVERLLQLPGGEVRRFASLAHIVV